MYILRNIIFELLWIISTVVITTVNAQEEHEQLRTSGSVSTGLYAFHEVTILHPSTVKYQGAFYTLKVATEVTGKDLIGFRYSSFNLYSSKFTIQLTYLKGNPPLPMLTNMGTLTLDKRVNSFSIDYRRLFTPTGNFEVELGAGPLVNVFNTRSDKSISTYSYGVFTGIDLKLLLKPFILITSVEVTPSFRDASPVLTFYGGYFISLGLGIRH